MGLRVASRFRPASPWRSLSRFWSLVALFPIVVGLIGCEPGVGELAESDLVIQCTKAAPCEDSMGVRYYDGSGCRTMMPGGPVCRSRSGHTRFWETVALPPDFRIAGCVCGGETATGGSRGKHRMARARECGLLGSESGIREGRSAIATSQRRPADQGYSERFKSCLQDYVDRANDDSPGSGDE